MPKRVRIAGERGRWLAEVEGRWLPVIHDPWRIGATGYRDPVKGANLSGKRYLEFADALGDCDPMDIQKDKRGSFEREGHFGVFASDAPKIGQDGSVEPTLTGRYADPANP